MTEVDWLGRGNPKQLVDLLADRGAPPRCFLLFAAACWRRIWPALDEDCGRWAVRVLDRYADGDAADLAAARARLDEAIRRSVGYGLFAPREALHPGKAHARAHEASIWAARVPALNAGRTGVNGDQEVFDAERAAQAHLLRDIVGNPFRPVTFAPAWRTPTAVGVARAVYDDRAFDRLPILADALRDAGGEDEQVLAHCRGDGPHARGCWAVDGVLGKY